MSKSRLTVIRPSPAAEAAFVGQAKTAPSKPLPEPPAATPEVKPARVAMRQFNIDLPEPIYDKLQALVKTMPQMSMRKFAIQAIERELERLRP
jgi:hypothetical protein